MVGIRRVGIRRVGKVTLGVGVGVGTLTMTTSSLLVMMTTRLLDVTLDS